LICGNIAYLTLSVAFIQMLKVHPRTPSPGVLLTLPARLQLPSLSSSLHGHCHSTPRV
jgi:hypothetical protein